MIGSVTWERNGVETTVTLEGGGRFSCPADPAAADLLEIVCRPGLDADSPADGAKGAAVLNAVAEKLRGKAWLPPDASETEPGVKY